MHCTVGELSFVMLNVCVHLIVIELCSVKRKKEEEGRSRTKSELSYSFFGTFGAFFYNRIAKAFFYECFVPVCCGSDNIAPIP